MDKPPLIEQTYLKPDMITERQFTMMQMISQRDDTYEKCREWHLKKMEEIVNYLDSMCPSEKEERYKCPRCVRQLRDELESKYLERKGE